MNRPTMMGLSPTSNGMTSKSIINSVQGVWRSYWGIAESVDLCGRSSVWWGMTVVESKKRGTVSARGAVRGK